MGRTLEDIAANLSLTVRELVAAGRKDLLLRAIGAPLLEELRIEAARAKLSRLLITKDYRFYLMDYGNRELELQPVHKAVYLLFLAHPEGIEFKRLGEYREELTRYYMATAKMMDKEKIADGVSHLVNPLITPSTKSVCASRRSFSTSWISIVRTTISSAATRKSTWWARRRRGLCG